VAFKQLHVISFQMALHCVVVDKKLSHLMKCFCIFWQMS